MTFSYPLLFVVLFGCSSDKGITAYNSTPEVTITSHGSGAELQDGYLVSLVGQVSDANHQNTELLVTWSTNNGPLCLNLTPSQSGETTCEGVMTEDDNELVLQAIDPEGATGIERMDITVLPTQTPSCEITAPEEMGVYYSDQLVTFSGVLTDAEDDAALLSGHWRSSRDDLLGEAQTPTSDGLIQIYEMLTEGQHAIEFHGIDSTGKTCLDSVIIDVGPPNSAPLCEITLPEEGAVGQEGDVVTFAATASDVDIPSDMLSVSWSSDKDGDLGNSAVNTDGSISFPFSDLSVDTHVITLMVNDEVGATCTSSITYTVGTPPSIVIDAPLDGETYTVGEVLSFSATVSDSQDQPDEIALDWTLNGASISTQGATSTGTAQFSDSTLSFGTYNLVVTATDTDGLTDSDQINFTINGLPTQPDVHIEPNPASTSDDLNVQFDTVSIDPEGGTVGYTYEWLKDGVIQTAHTSSTVPSSATSKEEEWTVRVTPSDGTADGTAGEASITIANTAPTLSSLAITPTSNVYNDITLTCSAVVTDPDETLTPTYEWSIGSTVVGSGTTLDLSASGAMPDDVVTCSVSVVDGDGEAASDSATTTVENRAPVVDSLSLAPSMVYTNDTITANATFSDADGQSVTGSYAWHVVDFDTGIDTEVQIGSDNTLIGVGFFDRGDEVYVVVTPNDGLDDGSPVTSSSITISNTVPTAPSVSLLPDPAIVGQDDLVCSVDTPASDEDGDSVVYTYVWTDDSGAVQQTTTGVSATSDTFAGSATSEGTWICEVTPDDGSDDGPSQIVTVDVVSGCYSLQLDGIEDGVLVGESENLLAVSNAVSMAAWVWVDGTYTSVSLPIFTAEQTNSSNPARNSGYSLLVVDGALTIFIGTGLSGTDTDPDPEWHADSMLPTDTWVHVVGVRDANTIQLYANGTKILEDNNGPTADIRYDGDGYDHTQYHIGRAFPNGLGQVEFSMHGLLSHVGVWNRALTETEVVQLAGVSFDATLPDLVGYWPLGQSTGSTTTDESALGNDGVLEGDATWLQTCPDEDLDGDGVAAWTDCDDNDASITTGANGASVSCPGVDCSQILEDGYSTGDGHYWIDPDGSDPFEVYCDMTTDGGGWTLIESYDFAYRSDYALKPFSADFPRNATTPGWDDHRLPQSHMSSLLDLSSEVHGRCHRDFTASQSDYIFADISLVTDSLSSSIDANGSNPYQLQGFIRGYDVQAYELWFYGEYASYHQHVDGSRLPQAATSEDNFGWADTGGTNTNHLCHTSAGEIVWMVRRNLDDADGDGVSAADDCDDNDASIYPFAGDVYGDGIDGDCDGFDCEADYDGNGIYFSVCVDTTQRSFAEVESYCFDGGYDGVALPLDALENDWIFALSESVWLNKPVSNYSIRLGGSDAATEGVWLHDRTGVSLTYLNWPSNGSEPNNSGGNEHCINMIGDLSYGGRWQDLGCHAPSNAAFAWSCEYR